MTLACGRGAWVVALLLAGEGLDLMTGVVGAANPGGVWKDFVSWTGSLPQQAASAGSAFLQSAGNRATEVSQVLAPKFEEAKSAAGEKLAQAKEAAAPHLEGAKKALAPHLEQAGQFVDTAHQRLRDASEAVLCHTLSDPRTLTLMQLDKNLLIGHREPYVLSTEV